jgi:hypothetical protein
MMRFEPNTGQLGPNTAFFNYVRRIIFSLICFVLISGCNDAQNNEREKTEMNDNAPPISKEVRQALEKIKDQRFLFAHHSVGNNILDGLRTISQEAGIELNLTEIETTPPTGSSTFVHFSPGRNTQPKTKIDEFVEQISNLPPDFTPKAAFLKFCYIDFSPETNVEELLSYYKNKIETLKKEYPATTFVHFTVPLTTRPTDIKSRIKRILGLQAWGDAANISRGNFNELLHTTFPHDPVFDIARLGSTLPDGSRTAFTHKGKTYYSLIPEYTDDGGHLNTFGRRMVASAFVVFLAKALTAQ